MQPSLILDDTVWTIDNPPIVQLNQFVLLPNPAMCVAFHYEPCWRSGQINCVGNDLCPGSQSDARQTNRCRENTCVHGMMGFCLATIILFSTAKNKLSYFIFSKAWVR